MARFWRRPVTAEGGGLPREQQHGLFDRLQDFARVLETPDPAGLANRLFLVVLALLAFGLVMQVNHAATTQPAGEFWALFSGQMFFRLAALGALIAGVKLGPQGLRRMIPALTVITALMLVL